MAKVETTTSPTIHRPAGQGEALWAMGSLFEVKLGAQNTPKWNFHKYLIGRDGRLIAAFGTRTTPTDPKVTSAIEAAAK